MAPDVALHDWVRLATLGTVHTRVRVALPVCSHEQHMSDLMITTATASALCVHACKQQQQSHPHLNECVCVLRHNNNNATQLRAPHNECGRVSACHCITCVRLRATKSRVSERQPARVLIRATTERPAHDHNSNSNTVSSSSECAHASMHMQTCMYACMQATTAVTPTPQ